jgi:hypothetical protein
MLHAIMLPLVGAGGGVVIVRLTGEFVPPTGIGAGVVVVVVVVVDKAATG